MVEISNDEIAKLVALDAQFYIGMATVDPAAPMLCRSWNVPLLSLGWPDLQ